MSELVEREKQELQVSEDYFALIQKMDDFELALYEKHEITNPNILARVEKIIQPAIGKHLQKAGQPVIPGELFKIDVPIGDLHKIKDQAGKYRAFVKGADDKFIKHAVLTPAQMEVAKGAQAAAAVANVMQVGAMVVGQYYMSEINGQLNQMNETLNDVKGFQDREFKAFIRSLIVNISQLSKFSTDYVTDYELARLKLLKCSDYRDEVTRLLEQVNLSIEEIVSQEQGMPFEKYEKLTKRLKMDLFYQETLLKLLEELSRLDLVFSQGVVSEDSSYYVYDYYLNACNALGEKISLWHKEKIAFFRIDMEKNRRLQKGSLKVVADLAKGLDKNAHVVAGGLRMIGVNHVIGHVAAFGVGKAAGELNKAIRYIGVRKQTIQTIAEQGAITYQSSNQLSVNDYGENMELLLADGKVYYLAPTEQDE